MVIATGFFDGVHTGHRLVLDKLVETARQNGDESMVITFWPHPRNVLQSGARNLRLLSTMDEKKEMIRAIGVDHVEVIRFTKEFSRMTSEEYLKDVVIGRYGGKAIVLGYDNRFGSDADSAVMSRTAAEHLGLEVVTADVASRCNGIAVSSTKIREALEKGDVKDAAAMLGYDYSLFGVVVAGNRIGRTMGFPTANMQLYEPLKLIPGNGAYRVKVKTLGREWDGMCNIGTHPTVGAGNTRTVETNIFGFDEDIYGLDIQVTFLEKIRDEVKFGSIDLLKRQLEEDRMTCMALSSGRHD